MFDIPFKHIGGKKKGTDYKKIPVLDVAGRQVNDGGVILQLLATALNIPMDTTWHSKLQKDLVSACVIEMGVPGLKQWMGGKKAVSNGARLCVGLHGRHDVQQDDYAQN
jgi:hypothetical protein